MKIVFSILLIGLIVGGCGKPVPPDPRLAQFETRITTLESNITELYERNENRRSMESNIIQTLKADVVFQEKNQSAMVELAGWVSVLQDKLVAVQKQSAKSTPTVYHSVAPSQMPADVAAQIRADAQQRYPTDYDMQLFRIKQQSDSWYKLHQ